VEAFGAYLLEGFVDDHEVCVVSFLYCAFVFEAEYTRRRFGNEFDDARQSEFVVEGDREEERVDRLNPRDARGRTAYGGVFLIARVRGVVGGDTVNRAVNEAFEQTATCVFRTQGWVHLAVGSEFTEVLAREKEVMGRDLTRMRGFVYDVDGPGMGYVCEMDGFVGDIDGAFDRLNLCFCGTVAGPDVGVVGVEVYVHELIGVLCVDGHEFPASSDASDGAFEDRRLDPHIPRRVRHEYLAVRADGAVEQFVGFPVGGHAGVDTVVDDGAVRESALLVERLPIDRRWVCVGLVDDGGNTARCGGPRARTPVLLVGRSGFAEVYVYVDGAG
jgi:hypothetical protein